jgi:hypothetical protein
MCTSGDRNCIRQRMSLMTSELRSPCIFILGTARDSVLVFITFLGRQRVHRQLEVITLTARSGLNLLETVGRVPDWVYLNFYMCKVTLFSRKGTCALLKESTLFC